MTRDTYQLTIHTTGTWHPTIHGLTKAELDESIAKIHTTKMDRFEKPGSCYEITTRNGQGTRIYGSDIAGFDHQPEN